MAIPNISDLKTYIGELVDNVYWNTNFQQIVAWFSDGAADLTIGSWSVASNCDMNDNKITALADPSSDQDAATKVYVDNVFSAISLPRNFLDGFILSNNVTTPNTKIDISVGMCTDDLNLSKITTIAAGTINMSTSGAGGLDTGSIAADTWYYAYVIWQADFTASVIGSLDSATPTLPGSYIYSRRVGAFKTDSSSNILPFIQRNNTFLWKGIHSEHTGAIGSTTLLDLDYIPPLPVEAIFSYNSSASNFTPFSPLITAITGTNLGRMYDSTATADSYTGFGEFRILTDDATLGLWGSATLALDALVWIDFRGRE